jgi:2'-5' RNA ligase
VNESRTKLYRYYLSYLLDDLPIGAKFDRSALHVTILPWFALEADEGPFLKWFYQHFDQVLAFDATVGERQMFGPNNDVPVNLLEPREEFLKLHKLALSWFGDVGARWAERDPYVGEDFVPHVAQREGYVLEEGQTLRINSLTLFKATRRLDNIRQVAAKATLDES